MKSFSFLLVAGIFLMQDASLIAEEIVGRVVDEYYAPLIGVSVVTNVTGVATQTRPNGTFTLANADSVEWVTFSYVGFESRRFMIRDLRSPVIMTPTLYHGRGIVVTADRAQAGVSPVAYADFTRDDIRRDHVIGEFPLLLQSTPNLYAHSDAGGGLGYSYMSIRGFDDKRVSTYINGVPLNDPEDQATYFVDLPDFASTATDVQVQRGIGNSLYGDASFGGTVNVVTSGLVQPRQVTLSAGFGEFTENGKSIGQMNKQTIEYSSGLIDGRWQLAGRYSKQFSDGYRRDSWYNGWSYFHSITRLDPRMTTEFHVYGGPMRMHLAYWGASRDAIADDRRSNPLSYDNETDNFSQPHYQLHNLYRLNAKAILRNTLYYIHGEGYYEQYKSERDFADYGIDSSMTSVDPSTGRPYLTGDLVRQQWVKKNQLGWNPRLDIDHNKGVHSFGGSFYYFSSDHWGTVVWGQHLNTGLSARHKYYEYYGKKWVGSAFAQEVYHFDNRLTLQATTQFRYQRYKFAQDKMGAFKGYRYDVDWFFFSPRLGITYKLDTAVSLFGSFAVSSRTPTDADMYDAGDPNKKPSLTVVDSTANPPTLGRPTGRSERVYDFELGGNYHATQWNAGINLFWMDFRNEILPYGGVNPNNGIAYTVNANRSVHAGVEFSGEAKPLRWLTLSGNLSLNYNRLKDYHATIWYDSVSAVDEIIPYAGTTSLDLANKHISGFPKYLGNFVADVRHGWFRVTYRGQFVGRQWMELYNIPELAIKPYITSSLSATASWHNFLQAGTLSLSIRVDNLFNKEYESSGYGGNGGVRYAGGPVVPNGWAEYFVAAERSFYSQVQLELF